MDEKDLKILKDVHKKLETDLITEITTPEDPKEMSDDELFNIYTLLISGDTLNFADKKELEKYSKSVSDELSYRQERGTDEQSRKI